MISSPLIWVGLPGLAGVVFWFLRRRKGLVVFLSVAVCLLLTLLAVILPFDQSIHIGPLSFTIHSSLAIAGRQLVLNGGDRTFLAFIFFLCAFWFAGSHAARANSLLIPFGLAMVALLVSAEAVEPFLYAALLVEMAVLLAVPMLAPPGELFGQGVLRFLIFQTLAMPFILLAGWALAGVETNPSNTTLLTFSIVFLGLGFAFWLAVFPFYTWIPLLAEQTYPYVSGFVFLLLPTINLLLGLNFLDRFGWLRASPSLYSALGLIGAFMVMTAGLWSAFQKNMARLMGYGVIVETGFSLLAISLNSRAGDQLFASMFVPRLVCLGLWAFSLSVLLREARSTRFEDMEGLATRMPFASAGLAVASLTLGGLPLLAIFPVRQALLEQLAQQSLLNAVWALAGSVGMLFSTFRALIVLGRGSASPAVEPETEPSPEAASKPLPAILPRAFCETRMEIALLVSGMLSLVIIGLFPQAFLHLLNGLLTGFPQLP